MRSNSTTLHKDAEWIDARRAFMLFTLGRTTLTRLSREKKIRSCSLAEDGMSRGKRLYNSSDLRAFLAKRAEECAA
jgi:hypothetical protein